MKSSDWQNWRTMPLGAAGCAPPRSQQPRARVPFPRQGNCATKSAPRRLGMIIREMTEDECRDVLARMNFGRLACARDNQPYVVPIYFSYHGGYLYGFSTMGQKIEWMRSNPL